MNTENKYNKIAQSVGQGAPINTLMTLLAEMDNHFQYGEASNQIKTLNGLFLFWSCNGGIEEAQKEGENAVQNLVFTYTKVINFLAAASETWQALCKANPELIKELEKRTQPKN